MNIQLLDYLEEGIIIFDEDYRVRFCNQSILAKLKYRKEDLHNKFIKQILSNQIESIIDEIEKSVGKSIDIFLYDHERKLLQANGKIYREEWLGGDSYWLVVKAYKEAKITTKELEVILENIPYAIWLADTEDNYKFANSNTLTMVNQLSDMNNISNRKELLEQHPEEVYKETLNKDIFKKDQSILRKGIMINEERMSANAKENLTYQLIKIPLFDEDQTYQGYIGMSQYNILKQNVDIAKVIESKNSDFRIDQKELDDQLVQSLEFSTRAARIFQGNNIIILKYNENTESMEEIGRLQKSDDRLLTNSPLRIDGIKLVELIEENTEWKVEAFEQKMRCRITKESKTIDDSYIRINPIEYNNKFMGAIFTTYESKLQYPLMDSCIIDKLCQHIAILFKSIEYSLELRGELLIRKEIEAEKIAYQEALQLETLKTEFLANMSHELKTPLNIIYSTMQIFELEVKEIDEEKSIGEILSKLERYKSIEKQNIFRLLRLINNITDISKMGAGYYQAKWVNCDIVRVIEDITMSVVEYVKNKELSIIFDTEVEELVMACDLEKIERIMLNLLSNAVKYTNKGDSIEVTLNIKDNNLVISVRDTGIGIPKEKQAMIFNRFAQVDTSFTRKCEGSGIGLALVKCLVEIQQGNIYVESEEGEGATFIVTIPIHTINETQQVQLIDQMDSEKEDILIHKCRIEFSDIYDL
ncbi:PAS domain-containing sensor histidine kinase [Niameybacter massiliensis]|uniref:PAS domain-containing sensor histidine kinase n=1 Tax=Niameybacter massiliensis TaxID=1658108 RepID=UPI0018E28BB6|nr:PAS domain-containing sensor histidine kinase [Niameybacter massiliensis]